VGSEEVRMYRSHRRIRVRILGIRRHAFLNESLHQTVRKSPKMNASQYRDHFISETPRDSLGHGRCLRRSLRPRCSSQLTRR
jgi:hypothetical protein